MHSFVTKILEKLPSKLLSFMILLLLIIGQSLSSVNQVLRMPVTGLLMDKKKQHCIGTRLASGQDILCQQLILDPSYKIPSLDLPSDASDSNPPRKVARGICIFRRSVKLGSSNVLVVFPPKSLQEQQVAALRVFQLGSNVAVCPPGM